MKRNAQEKNTLLRRADRSAWIFALLLAAVFGVMLCGNLLTDKFADDFTYVFSFADGTRVQSLAGLLASMRAHYLTVNGRVIAHTFVQIFETLPKGVFAAVNAGMFTLSLALSLTLCSGKSRRSNMLLLGLFAAVWLFMPAFGQVNFWLDGACNYLWAQVFALLFLLPYVRLYEGRAVFPDKGHAFGKILFSVYAVVTGAYSEALSGAALFIAILLLLLVRFDQKRKPSFSAAMPILTGIAGYAAMLFAPGEQKNKSAAFSALRFLYQAEKVAHRLYAIRIVIAALVVLFSVAAALHIDRKRMLLSGALTAGGVGSGLIFAFARYFPQRCVSAATLLLLLACAVLLRSLLDAKKGKQAALCLLTLLTLALCYQCPHGMKDVYLVHSAVAENRQTLESQKAAGETTIRLPIPDPETKYSALDGLVYLSAEDADQFPNTSMAKYYGVDAILGEQP